LFSVQEDDRRENTGRKIVEQLVDKTFHEYSSEGGMVNQVLNYLPFRVMKQIHPSLKCGTYTIRCISDRKRCSF
jgi:hypothetical protein